MKAAPTHPNMKLNPEQAPCSYISSNYQQTPSLVLTNFQKVILVYFHPYCSRFLFNLSLFPLSVPLCRVYTVVLTQALSQEDSWSYGVV